MDRWRAAWALLALAACFASSAAAPTIGNHTALDIYDAPKEGCYYNFQHYGEGDRIMTNEPCLNCTCHNRMLMCYLRVCPFTKAIGQDCTVEKRADQCCPIVTCPDVPVDLLTSTTTSPAEYGGTGVGKVDNYGCSINGRYFLEGAKVPSTPNKPCEHCYCIRNMTTCVMQECTLHVDGCTPIYHKDVCCPVRYHCDHPEDEVLLLDDMSTTVRPTPGFILTTPAPTEPPITESTRKDCVDNDQLYPDGALIKTEKPCVHCYCMKGDIVCVVQECGTPMENEGKNCTSLAPREGQCCPDTYICEGDELTSEFTTETSYVESTTLQPPRRVSVEGSGYRNEPDEIPYTEIPTFASEIEGSGEELMTVAPLDTSDLMKPEQEPTDETFVDKYATEGISQDKIITQSPLSEEADLSTAEPDEEFNIMPSESEKEKTVPPLLESSTPRDVSKTTQENVISEQETDSNNITKEESTEASSSDNIPEEEIASKEPASVTFLEEITTLKYEDKTLAADVISEQTTIETILESSSEPSILKDTAPSDDIKTTKMPVETEHTTSSEIFKERTSEHSITYETTLSELEATEPSIHHKTTTSELETKEPSVMHRTTFSELDITEPSVTQSTKLSKLDTTEPSFIQSTKFRETTEPSVLHRTTLGEFDTVEPSIMQSTKISELDTTEPSVTDSNKLSESETTESSVMHTTKLIELETTEHSATHSTKLSELERTEPSVMHSTKLGELETTESSVMHRTTYSESETVDPSIIHRTTLSELEATEKSETSEKETVPHTIEEEELEATRTSPLSDEKTTESVISNNVSEVESTEPSTQEKTTATDISSSTESGISEHNAITSEGIKEESSEPPVLETMTPKEETKKEPTIISEHTAPSTLMEEQSSEPSILEKTTVKDEVKPTGTSITSVEEQTPESGSVPTIREDENVITTESGFRRTGEDKPLNEVFIDREIEKATTAFDKESSVTYAYETSSADTIAPTDYEAQFTTPQPVKEPETKETEQSQEPITESIVELSTFAHITEKESVTSPKVGIEVESTTYVEKVEAPETSSINPEDNEIGEDISQISSPGRIPGEGDCLLNGITYKNDSVIPSNNKCHSGCKCLSSIVKCDPIICSPPPEYMENCQLTYDTPDSCCPTYVCDHSKETIPPQPHSQMSGTESPMPSPAIECNADQCDVGKVKQPPTTVFEPSEQPDVSECGSHGCDVPVLAPTHPQALDQPEECHDDKCIQPASCSDGKCEQPQVLPNKDQPLIPTIESETKPCQNAEECTETKVPDIATPACQGESCITNDKLCEGDDCKIVPGIIPTMETQQICENQEDCKQTYVPEISTSPCEGKSCSPTSQVPECVGENCVAKPELIPSQVESQICEKEEDCQQTSTSSDTSCEGESCTKVDCNAGKCNLLPTPNQEPEICTDEGECKKTEQSPPSEDKTTQECTDSECLQQKPISTTQQTTPVGLPITDLLIPEKLNVPTELPESLTTLSKETITIAPEIEESEISDKTGEQAVASTKTPEDYVTKLDESTTEVPEFISKLPESTVTEHKILEISTEESEFTSGSPKPNDSDTKGQEESSTTTEEKITETPKISESVTEISLDKESYPEIKPETQTEIPAVTELHESGTTKLLEDQEIEIYTNIPLLVEDQDSMRTELPEQDKLEVTKSPEVSETATQNDFNILPEVSGTDDIKHPESPITGVEQETSTVSQYSTQEVTGTNAQEFSVELTELPATSPKSEIELTEPSVYESEVGETENPEILNVSVESATKPQDISTETYVEQELTTKIPVPSITERVTETPESYSVKPAGSMETLLVDITNPQETITTELPDKIPDRSGTESNIETSTIVVGIETKLPPVSEIIETDVKTDSPELSITSSVKYEIVTETNASETHGSELGTTEETRTELPAIPTSFVQDASTPVSETMIDLEKIQTESPLSQVTISEPLDVTTQQGPIKEQDEVDTESPESFSKKPEESVLEEEKPVESPDSYTTEPPKMGTEITEESTSKPKIQSETSEKPEPEMEKQTELPAAISTQPEKRFTERPFTIATEQELVSEKESATDLAVKVTAEELLTTEQQDRITEAPVTSIISVQPLVTEQQERSTKEPITKEDESPVSPVTEHMEINTESLAVPETEYPYVPYEKPDGTKEESEISGVGVMGSDKPFVTEEYETDTEVPEPPEKNPEPETTVPDHTTETADLETKSTETSKIPEIVTLVPVIAVTETRLTDGLPESQEKVTEIPESHVSQDIQEPVSEVTESQAYITKKPEIYATDGKETTETPVQEKETKAPAEFVTEGLEISTTAPEVQATISEKDIIDQKVTATETPKVSETESPELPIVIQEIETPASEIENIEPEETITEEPSELITKTPTLIPAVIEAQTELPGVEDSGMDSQSTLTEQPELLITEGSETSTKASVSLTTKISDEKGTVATEQQAPVESITEITDSSESSSKTSVEVSTEIIEESGHTTEPTLEYSETTPYLIELEEHTHKIDEDISIISSSEQPITTRFDEHVTEHDELITEISTEKLPTEVESTETSASITTEKYETPYLSADPFGPAVQQTTAQPVPENAFSVAPETPLEQPQETSEPSDKETDFTSTPIQTFEKELQTTPSIESVKPSIPEKELVESTEKESTLKPLGSTEIFETTAPEEEFIPVTVKTTTTKIEEGVTTQSSASFDKFTKPEEKPVSEVSPSTSAPEVPKPGLNELQPTDEVPSPEDESQFPPSGGYGQEPDYVEEDQAFGPGTCRYGGKVYVSAQQIPRDDPCDFCFCFRSDIICLQQSCPPPIHGCHEEPIQGFCCPRYECPVSMATTLNVTTTTTTTTTTLPPHFLPHAYKGAAQRRGCQIKGHTYKVGEVVRASSGPCLHCTCGGDGQMKCDPKACTPEPMLRQMIAAAVSAKRRR